MYTQSFQPSIWSRLLVLLPVSLWLASCGGGGASSSTNYTVSAAVTGLQAGNTVVLANNGGNDTSVSANGTIAFSNSIAGGGAYSVTVATQPTGQTCSVANGSGTVTNANILVSVACTVNNYMVGGTVAGMLPGNSVTLEDNGGSDTAVSANGPFSFPSVPSGSAYAVTVQVQPTGQTCTVQNGSGTVAGSNITNIAIACRANPYNIGVTVSGPASLTGLVVQNNGGDDVSISKGGTYTFNTKVAAGSAYNVTILSKPIGLTCFVTSGSGTVAGSDVNVAVTCPWHVAYVVNYGAGGFNDAQGSVSGFYLDETTGALSPVAGNPFNGGTGIGVLSIDPSGHFAYVFYQSSANRFAYAIDATNGALTALSGSPFASSNGQLVFSPVGNFVYATGGINKMYEFSLNTTTGVLAAQAGSPFTLPPVPQLGYPGVLAIDPSGRFGYVGYSGSLTSSDQIQTVSFDPTTGAPTVTSVVGNLSGNSTPMSIMVDPTGRFVYLTDGQGGFPFGTVRGFTRDTTTGALTQMTGSPFGPTDRPYYSFALVPGGHFAYAVGVDKVRAYSVDATTGALTSIAANDVDVAAGNGGSLSIDPSGQFALVTGTTSVYVFKIDGTTGALTAVTGSPFSAGTNPSSVTIR